MNAPITKETKTVSEQIDYIEEIAAQPDMKTEDLEVVFGVSDGIQFEDTE